MIALVARDDRSFRRRLAVRDGRLLRQRPDHDGRLHWWPAMTVHLIGGQPLYRWFTVSVSFIGGRMMTGDCVGGVR
ncbi:hypothetical protein ABGB08_41395 [Acrocarpospora sp. B8E8]